MYLISNIFCKMKPTIAALFGVIAMACVLPPSVPDDVVKKFKERSQVKDEVELKLQEISNGLPFVVFDGREIPFGDEDLDGVKVFTLDAKVVVDGASQTPMSRSVHKQEGARHYHCQGQQRQARLGNQERQYRQVHANQSHIKGGHRLCH